MGGRKRTPVYRRRIFVYFIAIAIVPLLILGFYSYDSAAKAVRSSVRQANVTALVQAEARTERALDAVRQNFLQAAGRSSTLEMIEQEYNEIPYPRLRSFIDSICGDESYLNYGESYSFINYKKGWVLSNKGMLKLEGVENFPWLEELEEKDQNIFWINHIGKENSGDGTIESSYVNDHYLMFVVKLPVYAASPDAAFVVNIRQNALEDLLRDSLGNGSLLVFDQDGKEVYSENQAVLDYYQKNTEQLKDTDQTFIETPEGTYDIVKRRAAGSGWTYLACYSPAAVNSQLRPILRTMAEIILVVLALIGIISGFGSSHIYRPVKKLVDQMEEMVPGKGDEDEFELIQEGIHSLVGRNEELKDVISRQKNQLTELFAIRLIRGRLKEEEIARTREKLQIHFKSCLCVASVIFCPQSETDREPVGVDALNLELLHQLPEEIRSMLIFPPFIYTRVIVMAVDGENHERIEEKLLALRNCLSVFVSEICGGYIDMGASRIFEQETGFRRAYNESLEALKINENFDRDEDTEGISMEDSSITYYSDLIDKNVDRSDYDLVLDAAIKEAIDARDQEKAFAVTAQFLREVSRSKIVRYEQQYYFHRFLLAILSVPADAGIPICDLFPEGEENLFLRFNQLYDLRNIRKFFETQVILPVISRMNQFRKSGSEAVLEKIMGLVEESGGDLTLSECAQKLGYHPSYIWRVMKQTRDMTFTNYIAEQKLELARELLVETDCSVAEIAERLSYSNAQNFIRLFKKHMGITPGQYRKQNRP